MAEGYKEFTLSVYVCVCVCLHIPDSCPTHNFIVHGGIKKLFGTNDHQDKMMCHV